MAKIIERGEKTYTCNTCGCKFIIDGSDIKHDDMAMYYGGLLPYLKYCTSTRCPQCKSRVIIEWL